MTISAELANISILCLFVYFTDNTAKEEEDTSALKGEDVLVNWEDFKAALVKFVPSINAKDMEYFNKLKVSFS